MFTIRWGSVFGIMMATALLFTPTKAQAQSSCDLNEAPDTAHSDGDLNVDRPYLPPVPPPPIVITGDDLCLFIDTSFSMAEGWDAAGNHLLVEDSFPPNRKFDDLMISLAGPNGLLPLLADSLNASGKPAADWPTVRLVTYDNVVNRYPATAAGDAQGGTTFSLFHYAQGPDNSLLGQALSAIQGRFDERHEAYRQVKTDKQPGFNDIYTIRPLLNALCPDYPDVGVGSVVNQAIVQEFGQTAPVQYVLLDDGRPCDYFCTWNDLANQGLLASSPKYISLPDELKMLIQTELPDGKGYPYIYKTIREYYVARPDLALGDPVKYARDNKFAQMFREYTQALAYDRFAAAQSAGNNLFLTPVLIGPENIRVADYMELLGNLGGGGDYYSYQTARNMKWQVE